MNGETVEDELLRPGGRIFQETMTADPDRPSSDADDDSPARSGRDRSPAPAPTIRPPTTDHNDRSTPPGPSGLPLIGSALAQRRDPFGFTTRCARTYGDVVRIDYPRRSFYQLSHPAYAEYVLVDNDRNYVKGDFFNAVLDPVTGSGLLGSEGLEWRRQRQLVQPAFQPEQVSGHAETMARFASRLTDQWNDGDLRNIKSDMSRLALEIVAAALFDVDLQESVSEIETALTTVMAHSKRQSGKLLSVPRWVPTASNRRYDQALETLDGIVASIIGQRRADYSGRTDVLSMLLSAAAEQDVEVSDRELRDQVMTLLVAGHETTALVLTYALYLLARHPRVEATLAEEVGRLSGKGSLIDAAGIDTGTGTGTATGSEAGPETLPYTEAVVRESMRLYPPAHSTFREAVNADTIGGYHIPEGATIKLSQWAIHRDPRFYADAKAFRPERWTTDADAAVGTGADREANADTGAHANVEADADADTGTQVRTESDRHRFAFFPFGGGPRRCIGDRFALLEATLVLATIMREYHLELVSDPPLDLVYTITTRPADPIAMRIHKR